MTEMPNPADRPGDTKQTTDSNGNSATKMDELQAESVADMLIRFSRSNGPVSNTRMDPIECTFEEFCDRQSRPIIGEKNGSYLVRGQLLPGATRSDGGLQEAGLLFLDGDSTLDPKTGKVTSGAPDPAAVHEVLKSADIAHFIHTSHSHQQLGKGNKFRVIIPLMTPIKQPDLALCVAYLIELLHQDGVFLANVKENGAWSQPWFEPRVPAEQQGAFRAFRHYGEPFDPDRVCVCSEEAEQTDLPIEIAMPSSPKRSGPIAEFNAVHGIAWMLEKLLGEGYRPKHGKPIGKTPPHRLLSPTSDSRMPGVTLFIAKDGRPLVYSHHGDHDKLNQYDGPKKSHDAFDLFTIFEHDGDFKAALAAIAPKGEVSLIGAELGSLSELGNATRFVAEYGCDLRYVAAWGTWLVWSGTHWRRDKTGEVVRRMKESNRRLVDAALDAKKLADQAKLLNFALKSQNRAGIENALKLAQTEGEVVAMPEQFDADPWLLNCQNGTVDLKSGTIRPHHQEDLQTKILPVSFDPNAKCDLWLKFLLRISGNDTELCRYLQKAVGYSLTGLTAEQSLFYLFGLGRNGKSVFAETITELFGRYSRRVSSESLMVKPNGGGIPNDIAALAGARLVVSSEVEEGAKLNETKIKELTGGDTVTARFLHQEFFEFRPAFKLWVVGNHKPIIRGTDLGIWRRIRLIPFSVTIPESEIDPDLSKKLRTELGGILAWAVEGCRLWQHEGLKPPESVARATAEYQMDSDLIGHFIRDKCLLDSSSETPASQLYKAYSYWGGSTGIKAISQVMFTRKLTERGFQKRLSNGNIFIGITLGGWAPTMPD